MLNFSIKELCHSDIAEQYGIKNIPSIEVCDNLLNLIFYVLQPLRDKLSKPIIINSGYRCEQLNKLVGGVPTSNHRNGFAADVQVIGMSPRQLWQFVKDSGIEYDECILEYNSWVHLAYRKGNNRHKFFEIT